MIGNNNKDDIEVSNNIDNKNVHDNNKINNNENEEKKIIKKCWSLNKW